MATEEEIYVYELGESRGICIKELLSSLLEAGAKVIGLGSNKDMEDGDFTRNQKND